MKNFAKLLIAVSVTLLFTVNIFGAEADADFSSEIYSAEEFDVDSIIGAIPDEAAEKLPQGDVFDPAEFSENFSAEYFFSLIWDAFVSAFFGVLKPFSATMGLILIASVLSAMKGTLNNGSLSALLEFVSGLCIMLTLYSAILPLVESVRLYLTQLSGFIGAMVPVMIAIGTAGGNISASAVSANAMMLGVALVEALAVGGLFPVLQLDFGLSIASGFGGIKLGGISKIVRNSFTWIMGLVSAVISAVMSFQTSIASRADSLSMRAVRFAASNAVPVVGSMASDAVGAVAGSIGLIKGTVGWVGVVVIVILIVPVTVNIILTRFFVNLSCTVAEIAGLEREKEILSQMCGLLGFLAAVCFIASLMFVYALALFAKSGAALL